MATEGGDEVGVVDKAADGCNRRYRLVGRGENLARKM